MLFCSALRNDVAKRVFKESLKRILYWNRDFILFSSYYSFLTGEDLFVELDYFFVWLFCSLSEGEKKKVGFFATTVIRVKGVEKSWLMVY